MAQMNGELPGGQALGPAQGSTRTAHLPSRHSRMREAESEILDSNVVSPDNRSPLPILNPTEEEEAAVSPAHLAVDCEFYKNKSRKLMEENDSMRERMNGLEDMVRRLNAKLEQQEQKLRHAEVDLREGGLR
ncbi:SLC34A1 [Symbiodinium sp. CCMP2592]|nr:SLC34A1 [Symbiodinium sp. CCMP2592]